LRGFTVPAAATVCCALFVPKGIPMAGIEAYIPLLIYVGLVISVVSILLWLSSQFGPRRRTLVKDSPYESGTATPGSAHRRFSVHFYLIAMLFILFEVEAVVLCPWAINAANLGMFGFVEVFIFAAVLGLGLAYAWRKGALSWD
jgi:NADH-quinone oxidoreductase subunit A